MSLRREIHSTFDEIAPSTFGMPERVVQTVLDEGPSRRRKEKLTIRMRAPLSLVAVLVLIALIVGVLIGGRIMQEWNAFHKSSPAGSSYESQVAQLEAMPLHIPAPKSHADCQSGPYNKVSSYGSGPVYGDGGATSTSDWGVYYHNDVYAETDIHGPILIRARDLFIDQPVIFVGEYAGGPVVGSDTINGQVYDQHLEILVNTGHTSKTTASHKYTWLFMAGVPNRWSGSTGWQIDGIGFSEVFLAC